MKKRNNTVTDTENKSYEKQKVCHVRKKSFVLMKIRKMNLNYTKMSEIIAITLGNLEELLIVFEILVVIHNGSTYDYHFIIKQLAEEFKGRFGFL